jgi:hypothetical protein
VPDIGLSILAEDAIQHLGILVAEIRQAPQAVSD